MALITSCVDERDERKRTAEDASKDPQTTSKPGSVPAPGNSMAETYLLAMRCPVYRRRESHPGFRTELENLVGDAKGKGTSGRPARPKVPMRQPGADCPVVAMKRSNVRGAKGVGHPRRDRFGQLATGGTGRSRRKAAAFRGGTSRMSREAQVRICERLGVKFPGPTRRNQLPNSGVGMIWSVV